MLYECSKELKMMIIIHVHRKASLKMDLVLLHEIPVFLSTSFLWWDNFHLWTKVSCPTMTKTDNNTGFSQSSIDLNSPFLMQFSCG